MGLVYYTDLLFTSGIPFLPLAAASSHPWSLPALARQLVNSYRLIDFSDYDDRQLLRALPTTIYRRAPFYTYSFDPLDPLSLIFVATHPQVRFPNTGVFLDLAAADYQELLTTISASLSVRDADPLFDTHRAAFYTAVEKFSDNLDTQIGFYDRAAFELTYLATFSLYPPPP
jgi:hypothetical protein